jgi:hypothetical protein
VNGRNKWSKKKLQNTCVIGDRRCLGERQTRRRRVCRQTLVRVAMRGASDVVLRERQTRSRTLFQRLSLERVEHGAASRVRCICRLRTGHVCRVSHVYMDSGLRPLQQQTRSLRASYVFDSGMATSVGRDRRVCCLRRENDEFQRSRHVARRGGVRRQGEHLSGICRPRFCCVEKLTAS